MVRSSRGQLQVAVLTSSVLAGVLLGVGGYTFWYANGMSYLSDDPRTCVNCHIMREEYDGWQKASHQPWPSATTATCRTTLVHKFFVKASNGYHHSKAFTVQDFQEPIRIKPGNAAVLEANCIRCHGELVDEITAHGGWAGRKDLYGCVHCHRDVGHGPTRW